jgi:hypothetical protein
MKLIKAAYLVFCIFLLSHKGMTGQDVSVTAAFDSARILLGDQIGFIINIEQPSDISLALPVFRDTIIGKIEVIAGPDFDTISLGTEKIRVIEKYLVTSFDSGYHRVDPVYAELAGPGGIKRYFSDYSVLEVVRAAITPPDSAEIFDIQGPYRAPLTAGEVMPWALIALVSGLLIWLIIKLIRRLKKEKKEEVKPAVMEPSHVIAFRELEWLRDEQLWQKGETKRYYIRLTEIVRQYLENRYGINSLELTTSETLEALVKTGFRKNETYNRLRSVLNQADLVKFAKYKPDPVENDTVFNESWEFVETTRIMPQEEPGESFDKNLGGKKS